MAGENGFQSRFGGRYDSLDFRLRPQIEAGLHRCHEKIDRAHQFPSEDLGATGVMPNNTSVSGELRDQGRAKGRCGTSGSSLLARNVLSRSESSNFQVFL